MPRCLSKLCAFSLTEVVIALGIVSFVVIGIIGLFAVGLRTGSESRETIAAANLATLMINQRRIVPVDGSNATLTDFALRSLDQPADNLSSAPVYVAADGRITGQSNADFGLLYSVRGGSRAADVYMIFYWPPQAAPGNALGRYEIATRIALP